MPRLRTVLEWSAILIPLLVVGFLAWQFAFAGPVVPPSGLPDITGGFYQTPFSPSLQVTKTRGDWHFTLTSSNHYILAGRVVGKHGYTDTLPDAIIPLDIAMVNGELMKKDILSFFTFEMGYHTLKYSYDLPNALGLTEDYIDTHISNNHLVFLNNTLENQVMQGKEGDCVVITGDLIDIRGRSSQRTYSIDTSLVRNDSYPAGCEIVLVESYTPVNCGD